MKSTTDTYGFEVEYAYPYKKAKTFRELTKKANICGSIVNDCSIAFYNIGECSDDGGVELVSPIRLGVVNAKRWLRSVSKFSIKHQFQHCISKHTKKVKLIKSPLVVPAQESDSGFHIHIGVNHKTATIADMIRLYDNIVKNQKELVRLAGRVNNEYAPLIEDACITIEDKLVYISEWKNDKYWSVNIYNLYRAMVRNTKKSTIEFRYAHSSIVLDKDRMLEYFKLCNDIVRKSFTGSNKYNHEKIESKDYRVIKNRLIGN